ncbi:MAG TPA: heavy metal-associated domain-containing protein [Terriglobales bacterium]|nr:heavy metal-associated domain-containing protein [Terriglobales bacterium]
MPTQQRTALSVSGMTCGSCARTIERALAQVPGVERAAVDFGRKLAFVEGSAATETLVRAVEAAGYGAKPAAERVTEGSNDEHRRGSCCS